MYLRCWPVALSIVIAAASPPGVVAQRPTEVDVQEWLGVVQNHRPGVLDQSAVKASQWPWAKLTPILHEIQQHAVPVVILRSATMLSDIAVHVPVEERPRGTLLSGRTLIAEDGQPRSRGTLDSHLAAARRLLDALPPDHSDPGHAEIRTHVIAWYRTVSAVLASRSNLADLEPHVIRSLARFPDDAGILFDAGCFYETFGSPALQASMVARDDRPSQLKPAELQRAYARSPAALLGEAEKYFRRAVEQDPSFAEARVRLGRLLTLRGRAAAGARELQQAVRLSADDLVQYYALMFLGRAFVESGKPSEAMDAFRSAARLFPDAQSPPLAMSQLAAEEGDAMRAREAVGRVLPPEGDAPERFDPWWVYHRASGRDYESIYQAFSDRVQALPALTSDGWRRR